MTTMQPGPGYFQPVGFPSGVPPMMPSVGVMSPTAQLPTAASGPPLPAAAMPSMQPSVGSYLPPAAVTPSAVTAQPAAPLQPAQTAAAAPTTSVPSTWRNSGVDINLDNLFTTKKQSSASTPMKSQLSSSGNPSPVGYTQPAGYGLPAGMVGYQQPAMMGGWQPGMMGMAPMQGMMGMPTVMGPRPAMGYVQQPMMPMGMQTPVGCPPSAFGTSLQPGTTLRQ